MYQPVQLAHAGGETNQAAIRGRCHGTLGELWQGPVVHDSRWEIGLVNFPVPWCSQVTFTPCRWCDHRDSHSSTTAALRPRQRAGIEVYTRLVSAPPLVGHWSTSTELPVGVGLGSSTADIVAALRCAAAALGLPEDPARFQAVLRRIERSDPVHLPHPVVYLSGRQRVAMAFPARPLTFRAVFSFRGPVDTAHITEESLLAFYAEHRAEYERSFEELCRALTVGDVHALGRVATDSARLAQGFLPDPVVETLVHEHERLGAVGVIRAHTGTAAGLLYTGPVPPEARATFAGLGVDAHTIHGGF